MNLVISAMIKPDHQPISILRAFSPYTENSVKGRFSPILDKGRFSPTAREILQNKGVFPLLQGSKTCRKQCQRAFFPYLTKGISPTARGILQNKGVFPLLQGSKTYRKQCQRAFFPFILYTPIWVVLNLKDRGRFSPP